MIYVIWVLGSTIPKPLCDVLGFHKLDDCSLNLHLADSTIKKPMGRINDVVIVANMNYFPIYFIVLDIDCNPTCPIILGRPFLRTIGAIIDRRKGILDSNLCQGKAWNTSLERKLNYHMNLL